MISISVASRIRFFIDKFFMYTKFNYRELFDEKHIKKFPK